MIAGPQLSKQFSDITYEFDKNLTSFPMISVFILLSYSICESYMAAKKNQRSSCHFSYQSADISLSEAK